MDIKLWREPFDSRKVARKPGQVSIDRDRCKGCGYCVEYCPRGVLQIGKESNAKGYFFPVINDETRCLACGYCEVICPEFAIIVANPVQTGKK